MKKIYLLAIILLSITGYYFYKTMLDNGFTVNIIKTRTDILNQADGIISSKITNMKTIAGRPFYFSYSSNTVAKTADEAMGLAKQSFQGQPNAIIAIGIFAIDAIRSHGNSDNIPIIAIERKNILKTLEPNEIHVYVKASDSTDNIANRVVSILEELGSES